jgi:hypothetical protein
LASIHSKFQDSTFTTSPKGMTLFPQPMRNTLPWSCLPFDHLGGQPPFVTAGFLCYLCTSPVVTPKPHLSYKRTINNAIVYFIIHLITFVVYCCIGSKWSLSGRTTLGTYELVKSSFFARCWV